MPGNVEQLAGMDAAFLYMETPTQHMHVCGTMILEPDLGDGDDTTAARRAAAEELTELILRRISELPAFRRRIVETPLGLSHPAWAEVPRFRARNHVRQVAVEPPGTAAQLEEVVGRIASRPLDRRRPLWELWVIHGLENGRIGIVLKVHHAVVDGIAALGVLERLFTTDPGTEPDEPKAKRPRPRPAPTPLDLLGSALETAAQAPGKIAHTLNRTGQALATLARDSVHLITTRERPAMWFTSPRTGFNGALTSDRAVAFGRVPLATVKRIKNGFGVTVNDVVMAACARSLGEYLRRHGDAPQRPLVASVPISEHGVEAPAAGINRASVMFIGLPVHTTDPEAIVQSIHEQSVGGKRVYAAFGPYMLAEWVDIAPPSLLTAAMGLYSRWKLAEYVPPVHSLVVSNVPGPPFPLYAGRARVVAAYPLGPILEGAAVNITVISYADAVDIGLITCPQAVPRPWEIARGFERAIEELAVAADTRAKPTALYGAQA